MMLTGLANVLHDAGLTVVERPGWRTRGHGQMSTPSGVTCHHTASGRGKGTTLGLATIQDGRPGLAGPLAHLYLNRSGTFYVVAAGLCWHAGTSRKAEYENDSRIGIEALAAGDGWDEDWPDEQMDAYALGCRALAEHYDFPISQVLGHKETCSPAGRKIDPSFDMSKFRTRVKESDMALSAADKDWILEKMIDVAQNQARVMVESVLTKEKVVPNKPTTDQLEADPNIEVSYYTVAGALGNLEYDQDQDRNELLRPLLEKVDLILAAVNPPDEPEPPSPGA